MQQRLQLGEDVAGDQRQEPRRRQLQATLGGEGEVWHRDEHDLDVVGRLLAQRQDAQRHPLAREGELDLRREAVQRLADVDPDPDQPLERIQVAEPCGVDGDRSGVEVRERDEHLRVARRAPPQLCAERAAAGQVRLPPQPVGHAGDAVAGRERDRPRGGAIGEEPPDVADQQRRVGDLGLQPAGVEHVAQLLGLRGADEAARGRVVDVEGLGDVQRDVEHRVRRIRRQRVGDLLQHPGHERRRRGTEQVAEPGDRGQQLDLPRVLGRDHQPNPGGVDAEGDADGAPVAREVHGDCDRARRRGAHVRRQRPGRQQVEAEGDGGAHHVVAEAAGELQVQRRGAGRGEEEPAGQGEAVGGVHLERVADGAQQVVDAGAVEQPLGRGQPAGVAQPADGVADQPADRTDGEARRVVAEDRGDHG